MAGDKLRVMISSRSKVKVFDGTVTLHSLRERLRAHLESVRLFDKQLFEIFIHEDDTGSGANSWWKTSLEQIRAADLVIVLYNGHAGSQIRGLGIGICHAELEETLSSAPEKLAS